MRIGTKSLLFGAHQFLIHPCFVFLAWWRLYGFPRDPRLWLAFLVHDWGYWGRADLDGTEGSQHAILGARIMHKLFDSQKRGECFWYMFTACHSRDQVWRYPGSVPSRLCYADKLALLLEPTWFWLLRCKLTGEVRHFRQSSRMRAETDREWITFAKLESMAWLSEKGIYAK